MARLTTTVRDAEGNKLIQVSGRVPAQDAIEAARRQAKVHAAALEHPEGWTVTTARGSEPARSFEELGHA